MEIQRYGFERNGRNSKGQSQCLGQYMEPEGYDGPNEEDWRPKQKAD